MLRWVDLPSGMNLLVDHGSSHNLGDTGMIEGLVGCLFETLPSVQAFVLKRERLRTSLWESPRVHPVSFAIDWPSPSPHAFGKWKRSRLLRLLSRFGPCRFAPGRMDTHWNAALYALLGRGLDPSKVTIRTESGTTTLGEFVSRFAGYVVVGGGNLTDVFPHELWQRLCITQVFARQRKPILFSGQQIGPWQSEPMRQAALRTMRRVDFLGLREPTASLTFSQQLGLQADRISVLGDDSFGLMSTPPKEALRQVGLPFGPGEFLAINVRLAAYAASFTDHLAELAAIIRGVADNLQLPLAVVPIALNGEDSDITAGRRLSALVGREKIHLVNGPGLTPGLVKGVLAGAAGAVGASYHFCTFALSQGVPTVCPFHGKYYGQKAQGLAAFWAEPRIALELGLHPPGLSTQQSLDLLRDSDFRARLGRQALEANAKWRAGLSAQFHRVFASLSPN